MKTIGILAAFAMAQLVDAQLIVPFAVNQPPEFQVDAGADVQYSDGMTLQASALGGTANYSYQWSPAQFLSDSNSANPTVSGLFGSTIFTVVATDLGLGCSLSDQVQVFYFAGIDEFSAHGAVVFPNPSSGNVHVRSVAGIRFVQLFSTSGSMLMMEHGAYSTELTLDVSAVPAGVYFMSVELADGRSNQVKLCVTNER